jgi:hypothetical protein
MSGLPVALIVCLRQVPSRSNPPSLLLPRLPTSFLLCNLSALLVSLAHQLPHSPTPSLQLLRSNSLTLLRDLSALLVFLTHQLPHSPAPSLQLPRSNFLTLLRDLSALLVFLAHQLPHSNSLAHQLPSSCTIPSNFTGIAIRFGNRIPSTCTGILVLSAFSTIFGLIAKSFPVVFCQLLTIQFFHVRAVNMDGIFTNNLNNSTRVSFMPKDNQSGISATLLEPWPTRSPRPL